MPGEPTAVAAQGRTVTLVSYTPSLVPQLSFPQPSLEVPEVRALIEELALAEIGTTCNHYNDAVPGAALRRARLNAYLHARWHARYLLVGEAAGYRGCRLSGIAFTSEHQLGAGPMKEPSATIVHRALAELDCEDDVLLWNIVPTHPHLPGRPQSNRTPTDQELRLGAGFVPILASGRTIVPVGRLAGTSLGLMGLRHPAHGGARAFRSGLASVLGQALPA